MESHWYIHQIEGNYHSPDLFRYSLNSFIRSVKEIPQILKMELQHHPDYNPKIRSVVNSICQDPLLSMLHRKRDFIVHQGMLDLLSIGMVGTTEGRGVKIGIPFQVFPYESSNEAYERFKSVCRTDKFIRSLAGPDCDSWPCIIRHWKIKEFPDSDLLDVCISAWRKMGTILSQVLEALGGEELDLSLSCRHDPEKVRMTQFSQRDFFLSVDGIDISDNRPRPRARH
jgi:hypothetical protein